MTRSITPPPEHVNEHFTDFSKKSRHGHGQDVVDDNNIRQVAGCIPLDLKNNRVLLITSRKNKDAWVLPKGGWEQDETQKHAAQRETWEEAGIKGTITRDLGVFEERTNKKRILKAHHWIFEMEIDEVAKKFPEKKKRERRWFSFEESLIATQSHRYIQQAIMESSLNPARRSPPSPRYSIEDQIEQPHHRLAQENTLPSQQAQQAQQAHTLPLPPIAMSSQSDIVRKKSIMKTFKSIFQ